MDRMHYYQKRAAEHQREVSQELATRNLLGRREPLTAKQAKRLIFRIAFAIIAISLLATYFT